MLQTILGTLYGDSSFSSCSFNRCNQYWKYISFKLSISDFISGLSICSLFKTYLCWGLNVFIASCIVILSPTSLLNRFITFVTDFRPYRIGVSWSISPTVSCISFNICLSLSMPRLSSSMLKALESCFSHNRPKFSMSISSS